MLHNPIRICRLILDDRIALTLSFFFWFSFLYFCASSVLFPVNIAEKKSSIYQSSKMHMLVHAQTFVNLFSEMVYKRVLIGWLKQSSGTVPPDRPSRKRLRDRNS